MFDIPVYQLVYAVMLLLLAAVLGTLLGILSNLRHMAKNKKDQTTPVLNKLEKAIGLAEVANDKLDDIEEHQRQNNREVERRLQATRDRTNKTQDIAEKIESKTADIDSKIESILDTLTEMQLLVEKLTVNPHETYTTSDGVEHDNKVVTRDEDPKSIFNRSK